MKRMIHNTASTKHTCLIFLGIALLAFLILVNTAGAAQLTGNSDSRSNTAYDSNEALDKYITFNQNVNDFIKLQDKEIEINPQNSTAWALKGAGLSLSGKSDEAIAAYDQAIKINPHDSEAWIDKEFFLGTLGKYDDEIKTCNKAIEVNSSDSDSWYNKGYALQKLNRN